MAKLIASAIVLHALSYSGCDEAISANSLDLRASRFTPASDAGAADSDVESDSLAANCPASVGANAGQNGSISWLTSFDEDAATNASSVAVNARNDAFMTKISGALWKIAPDGAMAWSKPYGSLVAVTADDRVVVAGELEGTRDIDGVTLTSSGGIDVFLATLDEDGALLATTVLGGAGDQHAASLAVDSTGRVFVSGPGLGTVAVDEGVVAWQRAFNGFIATGRDDALVITGSLADSVDFGGGPLVSQGGSDVFVAKLDRDGAHQWSRRFGDAGAHQDGQAIGLDFEGNVVVAGIFDGTLDLGTGVLEPAKCPSEVWCKQSGFVAKLDADGAALWSRSLGAMRALSGVAATSTGGTLASGALPGNVEPYRMPRLIAFDAEGAKLWERAEWPEAGLGAGRQVAVDGCDAALWSVTARPEIDSNERAYLAKLLP